MKKAHLHLINWAVDKGYSVKVYGEGEYNGHYFTYEKIKEAVEWCDMGQIDLVVGVMIPYGLTFSTKASFAYIFEHEQDPEEIIYDYGVNEISEQWEKDYEATR